MKDKYELIKYVTILGIFFLLFIAGLNIAEVYAGDLIGLGTKDKSPSETNINPVIIRSNSGPSSSTMDYLSITPRERPDEACQRRAPKITINYLVEQIGLYNSASIDIIVQNRDSDSCLASEFNISVESNELETPRPQVHNLMPGEAVRIRTQISSGNLAGNFIVNAWARRTDLPSGHLLSNFKVVPNTPATIILTPFYTELEYEESITFDVFGYDEYNNYISFEEGELEWSSTVGYIYQNGTFYANETGEGYVFAKYGNTTGNSTIRILDDPCTHFTPTINLYPEIIIALPNEQIQVTAEITNNDDLDCVQALFRITPEVNNWEIGNEYQDILLLSGETKNITLNLTSPKYECEEVLTVIVNHFVDETLNISAEKTLTTTRALPLVLELTPNNIWMPAGVSVQYEVLIKDEFGNYYHPETEGRLTWETNAGEINDGLLIPFYTGNKYVKAIYEYEEVTLEATSYIEVRHTKLDRIEITPTDETIQIGTTIEFNAIGYDEYNNTIEITPVWNTTAGEINESGTVNATVLGLHEVTAEFTYRALVPGRARPSPGSGPRDTTLPPDGFHFENITIQGNTRLNVTEGPAVRFELSTESLTLIIGQEELIQAQGYDAFDNLVYISVNWESLNNSIATVSNTEGSFTTITAINEGTAHINVSFAEYIQQIEINVIASPPVIELLNPENILIDITEDVILRITSHTDLNFATLSINGGLPFYINPIELPVYIFSGDLLSNGRSVLQVYAQDIYGTNTLVNFNVLKTELPIINLISHEDGDSVFVGEVLVFEMSDEYFNFVYQWDDGSYQTFTDEYNITIPESTGIYTLVVYAVDTEGLGISLNETYDFTIQQTPVITLISPDEGSRVLNGDLINFTIEDDGLIVNAYYSWNDGYHISFTDSYNIIVDSIFLNPDVNILTVYARDNEGLETEVDYTFFGENTLPIVTVDPETESVITEGEDVTVYMIDNTGLQTLTYDCPIEGLQTIDLEGNLTAVHKLNCTWENGENTLDIIVYDIDGDNVTIEYIIYYDVLGPVITLISPIEGSVINEGDILVFNITDLTGIDYTNYTWDETGIENIFIIEYNVTVPDLSYGEHNITIYANDSLGYETIATFTFERVIGVGNISGRVWSYTSGAPLEDAFIQLEGYPELNATTNATGHYVIENVDPDVYNVQATKTGYTTQTVYGIGVTAGSETSGINFYLSQYGGIRGFAIDWFGNPVENTNVSIYEAGSTEVVEWTLTDAIGYYEIDNLSEGWYDVEATAEGYLSSRITNRPVIAGELTLVNLLLD
ncbi:carboxypeptidase-like regulatory domain-containing protein [Candidatus Micrarchaeota archaeon]|nr:carboxypeptidase-like regulatory domain-containing protein [Candidatus Micrarchaeota archaeon]